MSETKSYEDEIMTKLHQDKIVTKSYEDEVFLISLDMADVVGTWEAQEKSEQECVADIERLAVSPSSASDPVTAH